MTEPELFFLYQTIILKSDVDTTWNSVGVGQHLNELAQKTLKDSDVGKAKQSNNKCSLVTFHFLSVHFALKALTNH
jgi:hypothetical protein